MKKHIFLHFFCIFCLFFCYFCLPIKIYTASAHDFYYTDNIHHLFTHCLLAHPEIAFDKNNNMHKHYANDCITPTEFSNILTQLYQNNYVLIDINETFKSNENGKAIKQKVKVPTGKIPLILSFDDVVYDQKKLSKGMVDKIIIQNDKIATQTVFNNNKNISTNNEFVTILENFVLLHPDFSPFGAKGTICLTGYDGILGWRTSSKNKTNRDEEIAKVKPVIKKLKDNGWNFACHSYGHYHMKQISEEKLLNEIHLWQTEVEPLIGKTQVYVYPYGEWEITSGNQISPKHKILSDAGFKLFCGVGIKQFYSYLPFNPQIEEKVLFMDRACVDGFTLTNQKEKLKPYFNADEVIDNIRFSAV